MLVCLKCHSVNIPYHWCNKCKSYSHVKRAPVNWRPPKKGDHDSWKQVRKGKWLWDDHAVERKATRKRRQHEEIQASMKRWRQFLRGEGVETLMGVSPEKVRELRKAFKEWERKRGYE